MLVPFRLEKKKKTKLKVRFGLAVARGMTVVAFVFQPHLSHHQRQSTNGLVERPDLLHGADN